MAVKDGSVQIQAARTLSQKAQDTMADNTIIKITDPDSGETAEFEQCEACNGSGGYDASTDCEVYDDWQDCLECNGTGMVELGHHDKDTFIPERDALTPND